MQNWIPFTAVALSTLLAAESAFAGDEFDSGGVAFYDHARVTRVEPVYREVPVTTRVRECHGERRIHAQGRHHSYTPALVGGIVGGVVGNQFGRGTGRTVLTVAGAALGASVGHDFQRRHRVSQRSPRHSDCSTFDSVHYERELRGYRVRYRYQGQEFTTVTNEHPGRRMRLRVAVAPVGERFAEVSTGHGSCGKHRGDDYCEGD